MYEVITASLFYIFSTITVLAAILVIMIKNPVYSVLSLILAFFGAAGLFILTGAEFIAMTLVIVYVGAVSVLFLFVVMMLDINIASIREGFTRYWPVAAALACVIVVDLMLVLTSSLQTKPNLPLVDDPMPSSVSNSKAIGHVLYTDYILSFQIAGIILFVAMISCIVLTLRIRSGVRKQNFYEQLARKREDSITMVKVKSGEGINGIITR